jgi:hypothetical protein
MKEAAQKKRPKCRKKNLSRIVIRKIQRTKDRQTRLKIIRAVAGADIPWTNEVLLTALEDPCERIRDFIVHELAHQEDFELDPIYALMSRPPWYVKSGCLQILSLRKIAESVKHIEKAIRDPNVDVRRNAAHALGEIGGKEAVALLAELTRDTSHFVRESARKALEKTTQIKFS